MPYQWTVLTFGLATAPSIFTGLTKPIPFLCCCKGFVLLSIWMTSWSWFTLSGQVGGLAPFCVLYWFTLDCILIFASLTFASLRHFVLGVMKGYCPYVSIYAS